MGVSDVEPQAAPLQSTGRIDVVDGQSKRGLKGNSGGRAGSRKGKNRADADGIRRRTGLRGGNARDRAAEQ